MHKVDDLVSLADVLPTILNVAEVSLPPDLDGIDLMSILDSPMERDFYGVCADSFHCLIQKEFKYMWAKDGGEELLFDLKEDPKATQRIAKDLIEPLQSDGDCGVEPISQAFVCTHDKPGRASNLAEWNRKRR